MDHAERRIAVLHGIYNDPDGKQIIDLVDRLVLVFHLLIDTEKVLDPAVDLRLDPRVLYMLAHLIHDRLDVFFPDALTDRDLVDQIIVRLRLQILQRQVIQLDLDLGNTKPLCDRGVNIQRLPCDLLLLLRPHMLQRPHIVQPVCQLN